ncbi:MAG: SUMF1/EgtB/PvdO family nonheme iron enzyme [Magnetococcales bacterium]|nr:SUMF1/EgtB/PvdO family nonheme iron enzyme [Magnetococcales bacterium]
MKQLLQEIQKHLAKGGYRSMAQVRFSLIGSLLVKLGWPIHDPVEVNAAFDMSEGGNSPIPPMALTIPGGSEPAVIIELHPLGSMTRDLQPRATPGTMFHVLTDGPVWRFFFRETHKTQPDLCFKSIDLVQADPDEAGNFLLTILGREAQISGSARQRLEKKLALGAKKRLEPLRRLLPKAQSVANTPPHPELAAVLQVMAKNAGVAVTPDDVAMFLQEVKETKVQEVVARVTLATQEKKEWIEPVTGMPFIWVPGSRFMMGSQEDEVGRLPNEGPVHEVTLYGYWLAKYPVTFAQWKKVTDAESRNSPWSRDRKKTKEELEREENEAKLLKAKGDFPVESVLRQEAIDFINKLGLLGGEGSKLRLPTEAEWEFAARAGFSSTYPFEGDPRRELEAHAWINTNSKGVVQKVGTKKPNAWGFHDMLGNVWEWVANAYYVYGEAPVSNPQGPERGNVWVRRGGSCRSNAKACRPARRNNIQADEAEAKNSGGLGFRLAKNG